MLVDGASRGNPGEAGAGVVFLRADGRLLGEAGRYLGRATNNEAEYGALLLGLEVARHHGLSALEIVSDSELLVRQLKGVYRVREPRLRKLHEEVLARLAPFVWSVRHVRREENAQADAMANRAIDERLRGLPDHVWYG
ncbi:MAG TPA: ribonuclease HI family protein [Thermodesulfobacteriota bacterium]|nr:ribonuclease HI family protein [Thermodesulfobacteriota bacterium]